MAGMTNSITDYIGIVKVDGTEYLTGSTLFGTCPTVADDAAKVVTIEEITGFTPTHGLTIHVLFTNTNTASNPTLQFSSGSGAITYPIYAYGNTRPGDTISTSWRAGAVVSFTFYDGALDQTATAKRWIMNSGTDTGADGLASVALANVQNADDLIAIEALTETNGYLKKTAADTWALQTEQEASSTVAGITKIGASGGAATYEHTHGNITNGGALQTNDVTIGNGDKLVITDSSDGNKVARASLSFGANNTTNKGKALTQAGTWESFTNNPGTVTSVQVQGSSPVVSSDNTVQNGTLSTTISLASGYGDTQNPYASKTKNYVLAAPSDANGAPLFRALVDADIPSTIARLDSPGFEGTPTAPTIIDVTDSSDSIATTAFVAAAISNKLAANDAMLFKGTIGTGGTITSVPTNGYQAGNTYRVITAGTYAGQVCEIGDLLIAVKDGPTTGTSVINNDWTVAQTNIDGAVTTTGGSSGAIAKFDGAHSIVNGPVFTNSYDSSTAVTTSHKFLREDGTWVVPKYTATPVGYGKITVSAQSTDTIALAPQNAATTPAAKGNNETIKFTTANKWIVMTGTNSSSNADEIKFAHSLSGVTAGNYGDSDAQTPTYGEAFKVPYIEVDAAGHIISISQHNVTIPASDNSNYTARLIGRTTRAKTLTHQATTNTNTYLNLVENDTIRDSFQIQGNGNITVSSTAGTTSQAGVITIAAAAFEGATASTNGTAGYLAAPGSGNQNKFLQGSGSWKALSVGIGTSGTTGMVVVGANYTSGTLPTFTQGTLASASVSNGVLTIVSATADTFTQGSFPTLTLSKADLSITAT